MPLSASVLVVLRLIALNWLFTGLIMVAGTVGSIFPASGFHGFSREYYFPLIVPLIQIVISSVLCYCAPFIARTVTPRPDPEVKLGGLTQYDLYCFAFVLMGVYFMLSSISAALAWLHYSITPRSGQEKGDVFYQVMQPLITFVAGCLSTVFSHRFARKLTSFQQKPGSGGAPAETGSPQTPPD